MRFRIAALLGVISLAVLVSSAGAFAHQGFYFFKDGKMVTSVLGWPGPEQLVRLRAGFGKIGVR